MNWRLGIIGSSGGSALAAADNCLSSCGMDVEWVVITDRACGMEEWAKKKAYSVHRIDYQDGETFARKAFEVFENCECSDVLLFYTRRIYPQLFERKSVFNIHPSLLPAFAGLHGVRDAMNEGVRILGATLHHVDQGLDTGKIIAQVAAPLPVNMSIEQANHISFCQKVWLSLVWVDQLISNHDQPAKECFYPSVVAACPGIANDALRNSYKEWFEKNIKGGSE